MTAALRGPLGSVTTTHGLSFPSAAGAFDLNHTSYVDAPLIGLSHFEVHSPLPGELRERSSQPYQHNATLRPPLQAKLDANFDQRCGGQDASQTPGY
jgi:hypothetical protein